MIKSYQTLIADWGRLLAAVRANEVDFPALTAYKATLEDHLESVRTARAHQLALQAGSQEATRDLHRKIAAGWDEVRRLRSRVKAELGIHDPRLRLFGIAPIGKRKPRPRLQTVAIVSNAG